MYLEGIISELLRRNSPLQYCQVRVSRLKFRVYVGVRLPLGYLAVTPASSRHQAQISRSFFARKQVSDTITSSKKTLSRAVSCCLQISRSLSPRVRFAARYTDNPLPRGTPHASERAQSYFRLTSVILRHCTGSPEDHWNLARIRVRSECQLNRTLSRKYGGDMRRWFRDLINVNKTEALAGCWEAHEGDLFCDGRASRQEVILNIPVVLIIEMGDMQASEWNISGLLTPYASNPAASAAGVKYNIVGHIYCSLASLHFITRYLSIRDTKRRIFDYNGKQHEGHAIRNRATAMRGCLTGPAKSLAGVPEGYMLYAVVYHLEGGEKAQQFFRKQQMDHAQKIGLHFEVDPSSSTGIPSSCQLRRPNVHQISDEERFWSGDSSSTVDYTVTPRPRSPRKAAAPVWHAPMPLPAALSDPGSEPANDPPKDDEPQASHPTDEEDLDEMLIDAISTPVDKSIARKMRPLFGASPPPNLRSSGRKPSSAAGSSEPFPVWCDGCNMQNPDGDDDDNGVQCESCKYWSHTACLTTQEDWEDPDIVFFCKSCRAEESLDLFQPQSIVMVPDPDVPNWKAPGVLWYPARFVKRHKDLAHKPDVYEFEWLECNDGTIFHSAWSDLPALMLRMFCRGRQFCQEIHDVTLSAQQIGKICMPFYMKPDYPDHKNPQLSAIFKAAVHGVARILLVFEDTHPVVSSYNRYFADKKTIDRHREAGEWMRSIGLVPSPELEAVLAAPLGALLKYPMLARLLRPEREQKVLAVGSALLQLLAVQHCLGEPLDLNGDTLNDLEVGAVVRCSFDGPEALTAMFSAIPLASSKTGKLASHMVKFSETHAIYDSNISPPTYSRLFPSPVEPTESIVVVLKRKGDSHIEGERAAKKAKSDGENGKVKKAGSLTKTATKRKPANHQPAVTRKLRSRGGARGV
ncbi:hypothetical protein DFH06DRAFT_1396565 [Mycena polygramma]|nr:hypothetical protein DFH06DRAFT_1396565 [Mycena polygramma]